MNEVPPSNTSRTESVPTADASRFRLSLRAAKQCLECHSVQRGDLLGAFSYELRRASPEDN